MTQLDTLLSSVSVLKIVGTTQKMISSVVFDSRKVEKEAIFVAIRGTQTDGHYYISSAIEKGATVVVCEELPSVFDKNVTYVQTSNSQIALGKIASAFYGHPSEALRVVAVTGTNGKTTTVTLLYRLFTSLGYRCGLISTVENRIGEKVYPAQMTTPDALTLQQLFAEMKEQQCSHCFMEASSHAIHQNRLAGVKLEGAVFTNITHDHLDYHKTFENYIAAKKKLFDELPKDAFALVNVDDKRGRVMLQNCQASIQKTFALKNPADFKGKVLTNSFDGLQIEINGTPVWFRLIGEFNAYNLLGIYGTAILLEEDANKILLHLSQLSSANGRFEKITSSNGIHAIVDYAHTPDALQNVLETIYAIRKGKERIITVVGCGGERDKAKRPMMAKIAAQYSDKVFLTADNPRSEEVMEIISQMYEGLTTFAMREKTVIEPDRAKAIQQAIRMANPGDMVLIAGKGHESYQEIKGIKYPFSDKEEVIKNFSSL
ncbi:MAG: UDP-N-acetylmuramoyl-L-alanyl-D-glutamate--2,6-diaminopimelate ligase [Cytophagales bacterium]|nr:UDP-N-acetylmuramoyl-L-alanyl-D-glutamate--2,6-diaminopimelate ligase [Cytophagales bacterium]MDW8384762.1 UDP-N-acetylmuramoyl-L-alanyl-D-glutamate--2,6-diaminopimelate ligase [Flammeovirgaceae bacterium]